MIVDILSDLHLDFYFKPHLTTLENVSSFFEPIFTNKGTRKIGDVLISNHLKYFFNFLAKKS